MGWAGIIGLVTCGVILPVERAFPGYLALWPVISGALVIMAGRTNSRWGIDRLLVSAPRRTSATSPTPCTWCTGPSSLSTAAPLVPPRELHRRRCHHPYLHRHGCSSASSEKPLRYRKDPFVPWLMMKMRFKTIFSVKTWADQLAFILAIFLVAGVPLVAAQTWIGYPQHPVRAQRRTAGTDRQ